MIPKIRRLRELDFLRGVAIILVLFRHQYLFQFTRKMGWIGVDLFFVLSGFLVSGLLFKEYLKQSDIRAGRFLIRRGFKIYPIYYIFYILYLIPKLLDYRFSLYGFIADMTFTQNYLLGWGYGFAASWSLAVEEHFYICLVFFLSISAKKSKKWQTADSENRQAAFNQLEIIIIVIMALCLVARIATNIFFPNEIGKNFTMTHLRIDSLLAGVLISYLYYFKPEKLKDLFNKRKILLGTIAFLCLVWTPFIEPDFSFFVKTVGFSLTYASFGIILTFFILYKEINQLLNSIFSNSVVDIISKVGYCSYSIYIIHSFVNWSAAQINIKYDLHYPNYLNFVVTSLASILLGMGMTYVVETYFLKIRDKYYPARTS